MRFTHSRNLQVNRIGRERVIVPDNVRKFTLTLIKLNASNINDWNLENCPIGSHQRGVSSPEQSLR